MGHVKLRATSLRTRPYDLYDLYDIYDVYDTYDVYPRCRRLADRLTMKPSTPRGGRIKSCQ